MKGGVGKTTIGFQTAFYAQMTDLKCLLIDLDPQANLSQALMGYRRYARFLRDNEPSVINVLQGFSGPRKNRFAPEASDIEACIVRLKRETTLDDFVIDLIPSRLELARVLKKGQIYEQNLARALSVLEGRYDLILIDCAPTDSLLTEAAYWASRFVLVPVKPEYLATIGFPLLHDSLEEFQRRNRDHAIEVCGVAIVPTGYKDTQENKTAKREIAKACREYSWKLFENVIPYSATFAKSSRQGLPVVLTSHVRLATSRKFYKFSAELLKTLNLSEE